MPIKKRERGGELSIPKPGLAAFPLPRKTAAQDMASIKKKQGRRASRRTLKLRSIRYSSRIIGGTSPVFAGLGLTGIVSDSRKESIVIT
jgi:hypothetical protein